MDRLHLLRGSILASLGVVVACSKKTPPVGPDAGPALETPREAREDARARTEPRRDAERAAALGLSLGPDGHLHRAAGAACDPKIPGDACPPNASAEAACRTTAACGPHAKCVADPAPSTSGADMELLRLLAGGDASANPPASAKPPASAAPPPPNCHCETSCASDADCKKGEACLCFDDAVGHSRCIPAACRVDADCASGKCELSEWHDGCGMARALGCRSAKDQCQTHADCSEKGTQCAFSIEESAWRCAKRSCMTGRPLTVAEDPRTAEIARRADWACAPAAGSDARRWADIALLEHASIASFAIFTLELLQLGAPAELVRDAQLAALDEIEHARLAFAHASAKGSRVGPGPIDMSGVRPRAGPREIARALFLEGCVGETIGAAEARRDAEQSADSAERATFARIADDEARHAALAWRALAWMARQHPEETRSGAMDAARAARAAHASDPFRARVMEEVVTPCARALDLAL